MVNLKMMQYSCCLLWNYVAATSMSDSRQSQDDDETMGRSSGTKSSSSKSSSSRVTGSSSSRSSASAVKESSRTSSSSSSSRVADASSTASKRPSSSSAVESSKSSSSSGADAAKPSGSSRSSRSKDAVSENKDEELDPWEKSHPSAHLSSQKDRARLWPFPIGFDKARPAGEHKLWWESGIPHIVGSIEDSAKQGGSSTASSPSGSVTVPPDASRSDSERRKGSSTSGSKERLAEPSESTTMPKRPPSQPNSDPGPDSTGVDVKRREKMKAAYMKMKKDPNADPELLRKLKKSIMDSSATSTDQAKDGASTSDPGVESNQDKIDVLTAQYMKLKGNPASDADEMKRLKREIGRLREVQRSDDPIGKAPPPAGSIPPPAFGRDPALADQLGPTPEPSSGKYTGLGSDEERQKLKARYLAMKGDPDADPEELKRLKAAIIDSSKANEVKSAAFAPNQV